MTARPQSGKSVSLEAKPEPIEIEVGHIAVLVIDMQNDFGAKGGMFDRAGIDISIIRKVIGPISHVLDAARAHQIPIIYLTMQHRPDLVDMGDERSPHHIKHTRLNVGLAVTTPDGQRSRTLVAGEWGTQIVPELSPKQGDLVVPKHRYSGFFETELDSVLHSLNVRQLIVTGCTTSVCVESTIRDAMYRDYQCVLLEDCTAEPIGSSNLRGNHDASLLTIELLFGWITDSQKLIGALQ